MKLAELKEEVQKKNLILHKYGRKHTRRQYVYSTIHGETIAGTFFGDIDHINEIPYMRFFYFARTKNMPSHKNYKITASDYKELLQDGAIEEK